MNGIDNLMDDEKKKKKGFGAPLDSNSEPVDYGARAACEQSGLLVSARTSSFRCRCFRELRRSYGT